MRPTVIIYPEKSKITVFIKIFYNIERIELRQRGCVLRMSTHNEWRHMDKQDFRRFLWVRHWYYLFLVRAFREVAF